ncbi:MAG TPA: hypothetical protein DDY59_11875, partial [Lachnospiraceae bacterium]|nr:hypothetical protein [Lachnospiraceae bacterium]
MRKKLLRLCAVLLVICMAFTACGSKGEDTKEGESKKITEESGSKKEDKDTAVDTGKDIKDLKLGCNNFMKGIYSVDILENGFAETCKALGIDTMIVNDEGKVEKTVQNVDNMISAGVDGIVFFGISETLFPVVSQKCQDAKIPFVCY